MRIDVTNTIAAVVLCSAGAHGQSLVQEIFPHGAAADYFGWSLSADGDRMAVGAPKSDTLGYQDNGLAYIYSYNADEDRWEQEAHLTDDPAGSGKEFGTHVVLSGDLLAVSNKAVECGVGDSGCWVSLFDRTGDVVWHQVKRFFPPSDGPDAIVGGTFGRSIALDGDILAIGGGRVNTAYGAREAVVLFKKDYPTADAWGVYRTITAGDLTNANNDGFGDPIALNSGWLWIGAPGDDALGVDAGAVYVHDRDAGGADAWGLSRKVLASNGLSGDRFGSALAVHDDRAVVAAAFRAVSGAVSGAAYVFLRDLGFAGNWGEAAMLGPADPVANMQFGWSVDIRDRVIAIGAPRDDADMGTIHQDGATYLFVGTTDGLAWSQVARVPAEEPVERFGHSVALVPDGFLSGAPWNNTPPETGGRVRYYHEWLTGVNELGGGRLSIGPNPFRDSFVIELGGRLQQEAVLRITDVQGRLCFQKAIASGEQWIRCDANGLSAGTYVVILRTSDGRVVDSELLIAQ